METVLDVALPFFALIGCGWLAGRFNLLKAGALDGLNGYILYFALPALLFFKMGRTPILEMFDWRLVAAYTGTSLVLYYAAAALGRALFGHSWSVAAMQGISRVYSNIGYMGIPLVVAAYGDAAAFPAVLILLFDIALVIPMTMAIVETAQGASEGGARHAFASMARNLPKNPLILAILGGTIVGALQLPLPRAVLSFGDLLGNTGGPCALFAIGATLVGRPLSSGIGEVSYLTIVKSLVHPLLVFMAATYLFEVDPLWRKVAVVCAALPVAANVFVLAQQYGIYTARASTAILMSTIVGVGTVTGLMAYLG